MTRTIGQANVRRGAKWYAQRNKDTNEMPDWHKSQESIMVDVEAYLDSIKPKEKPKVVKEV